MTQEEKRLTYRQIINILCILAVRQERIIEALLEFGEQQKFQTFELLKAETKIENYSKKIFYQKVRELENSHQGLVNWIHEQLYKEKKKPTEKYKDDSL